MSAVDSLYKQIGERIKQAREDRGWTQAQLGEALGYSQATIGNYELGRRHVGLDDLYKIADALQKPYAYFLGVDRQVEEETRRELEQKVRRDMADLVGVRMLPLVSTPVAHDAPLTEELIISLMPVARELAPGADMVFSLAGGGGSGPFGREDYIFVNRAAARRPGEVWVIHAGGQVDLVKLTASGEVRSLTGCHHGPETPQTLLGAFSGLYTASPPAAVQGAPPESEPPIWADLDPADQQQVTQFVEFLRARKGPQK
ncbi:MAG: helix-turn-helix domain-containing protein [Bacillota bacterium]